MYRATVSSIPCPRVKCSEHKRTGRVCPTSSTFHQERVEEAKKQGLWSLAIAKKLYAEGKLNGEPIDAFHPKWRES